jgi:DNA-binding YbaB/EbfC family protein
MDPRKLQSQMMEALQQAQQLQEEAASAIVEESAGGGMVTVKANGAGEILEIKIAPEAIDPDDPELLADLVLAAVNAALAKSKAEMEAKMSGLMGGLNLGGLGLPGM